MNRTNVTQSPRIRIHDEVTHALREQRPVVALESSFLAHGLPQPHNLETARAMLSAIEVEGAVPAMVAIIDGEIRVGIDDSILRHLGGTPTIAKASARDLGILCALRKDGATTVAGTLVAAARAGIGLMATGGIGGVHLGAETTYDVSADLGALASCPIAVVCSGAKSILDLGKTLEMLETEGVPLVGYQTDRLPGFHIRVTEHALEHRVDTIAQAADVIAVHRAIGGGGMVLCNPCPEDAALPEDKLKTWTAQAHRRARAEGIAGKQLTPFLLRVIGELSGGRTLEANKALLVTNAALAARIASAGAR